MSKNRPNIFGIPNRERIQITENCLVNEYFTGGLNATRDGLRLALNGIVDEAACVINKFVIGFEKKLYLP